MLVSLCAAPVTAEQAKPKLLIGLIPEMNIFKQKQRFQLLGEYLSQKTGMQVQFTILSRYGNIIDSFKQERMDGAFFGSFTGALAIEKLGVIPLARPVNLDNTSAYRGYLFVRKDSGIRDVKDMKGRKMAFVEKATTAGYVFPLAYLKERGITDIKGFFSETFITGSHDAAINAVLNKKADIGAAKHSMYDRVRAEDPRVDKELVVIATSPWVPSNGLCVRKDLDKELQKKLKEALLGLHQDPAGGAVLAKFGALQFIETTAKDYQPVFEMARHAGIDIKNYRYRNE
ncbi:MAG TPA: phosphate/phosphite/phosphonate ABC transporter substrate-binding protein [Nitrospirota bacterium]|nr:phosphate/phosphite/phosphonate ABC transporter substrate-binding protein [Nitrospirota bacterium]